jgi:type I restriction enzyme S subunit
MTVNKNIPKHWQVRKLGEVCEIIMGQSPPSTTYNFNGIGLPFFQGKAEFTELYPVVEKWCSAPNKISLPNDVLLSVRAPVGTTNIANQKCCIGRGLAAIRYENYKYIFYFLRSIKQQLDKKGTGTTFRAISGETIRSTEIPLPPLPEQRAIVSKIEELLSDLDNGKQQLLTAQQQLKVYRQSLLKWAFEGKLTASWRESQKQNKNNNLAMAAEPEENYGENGELPEGWKWVELGDVCSNVEYGSAIKSKKTGKVPVLRMGNIQKGRFDWDDLVFTDDDFEIKKYLLKKNDVLFNRTNSAEWVGKTAIYKGERPAIFAGYLIRINRFEKLIDADYLTYYLNTHAAKQYGNSVRSFGVNQSNINGTKLKTYPIPLPLLEEQQLIVDKLESKLTVCDKIEETIAQSLLQAETLRQSILKRAFEGRLV